MKKSLLAFAVFAGFALCASAADTGVIYSGLVNNAEGFTFSGEANYPESMENKSVWGWDDKYGLVASAYYDGASYVSDVWAVSPVIDLAGQEKVTMTLSQAANKFKNHEDFVANTKVCVREVEGEWNTITITTLPDGSTDWTFVDSEEISLNDFAGKKIQVGFNYTTSANGGGKWEIKNLQVTNGNYEDPVDPTPDPSGEKGTLENPLSVDDILSIDCPAKDAGEAGWYVRGYIVGYVSGMNIDGAVFGATGDDVSETNFLLGGSSAEDDVTACLPVQLPKGIRDELNLKAHPSNLGKEIVLCGTYEKYFGVPGFKNLTSYKLGEGGGDDPVTPSTGAIYTGLVNNAEGWEFSGEANYPESMENKSVWAWDDKYGLVASAYFDGASYVSDVWAVSPVIDLAGQEKVTMTLSQAANKFKNHEDFVANTKVCVREVEGEWNTITITTLPDGSTDWTFVDSEEISLNDFAGKKIQVGFNYTSSENGGGKWEIKNLTITGESGIAAVDAEEGVATYYNLQGMRVLNPENGLYIERRGNKARKVIIRK